MVVPESTFGPKGAIGAGMSDESQPTPRRGLAFQASKTPSAAETDGSKVAMSQARVKNVGLYSAGLGKTEANCAPNNVTRDMTSCKVTLVLKIFDQNGTLVGNEQLVGIGAAFSDDVAVEQAARQLLEKGIQLVVISMGEKGAMFVDATSTLMAVPPSVMVKSTVGAGDAMVSGLVAGHAQGWSLPECARFATACSLGAITNVGHNLPASEMLQAYVQQVTIHTATHVPRSA